MSEVYVGLDVQGLEQLQRNFAKSPRTIRQALESAQRTAAPIIQRTARNYAPRDKGQLHTSIQVEGPKGRGMDVETAIGTKLRHARFQEFGTGIYGPRKQMIRPKTKKVLAWNKGGKWHFAKAVRGSKPHFFMKKARTEGTGLYRNHVRINIAQALKEI